MYIRREIESTIDAMLTQGKVVLITGARQIGKTTVLKEHLGGSFSYVSMENPRDYLLAKQDAVLFFDSHELPLIVDEVQRVPELFSPVKWIVDQSDQKGRIVLTGSQTYRLMKGVSESLAGRMRIIEMPPLSLRELIGSASSPHPYVPTRITEPKHVKGLDIWSVIHRGSMPELQDSSVDWDSFYSDYVSAYLERDVRDLINVQDEAKFYSFMVACAARSGQLLNATDIGNAIDVDHKTVKAWLSVLQASNIVRVIQPFRPNVDKHLSKTSKIFFMDTGLVCHLTRWTTPEQLRNGAVAGHVFEGCLQDLGFGHGDACGDLVGDFLTPGVSTDIQLQGVVHTLGLNEFDGEQVGSAEGVFVTVEFGGERPGAQGFEGVIAHVAMAHGQGGAFGEEFTQAVRGVADGHSVFGDSGALDGEARPLGPLSGGRGLGGLGGFICVCGLGLQCEGACCGGSGGTLQEESS